MNKVVLTTVLVLCLFTSILGNCWLFARLSYASFSAAAAEDSIRVFEDMRTKALASETLTAVDCLEYVVRYYPSGSERAADSRMDRIVESARRIVIQDIITHLRKTHADLGDDPNVWIAQVRVGR